MLEYCEMDRACIMSQFNKRWGVQHLVGWSGRESRMIAMIKLAVGAWLVSALLSGCQASQVQSWAGTDQAPQGIGACDDTGAVMSFELAMSAYGDFASAAGDVVANDRFVCLGNHIIMAVCLPPLGGTAGLDSAGSLICFVYASDPDNAANRLDWNALEWQLNVDVAGRQEQYVANPILSNLAVAQARQQTPSLADMDVVVLMFEVPASEVQFQSLVWQPGGRTAATFDLSDLESMSESATP
jgi:hypothetical protein